MIPKPIIAIGLAIRVAFPTLLHQIHGIILALPFTACSPKRFTYQVLVPVAVTPRLTTTRIRAVKMVVLHHEAGGAATRDIER